MFDIKSDDDELLGKVWFLVSKVKNSEPIALRCGIDKPEISCFLYIVC